MGRKEKGLSIGNYYLKHKEILLNCFTLEQIEKCEAIKAPRWNDKIKNSLKIIAVYEEMRIKAL